SLENIIRAAGGGQLSETETRPILLQIATVLATMHEDDLSTGMCELMMASRDRKIEELETKVILHQIAVVMAAMDGRNLVHSRLQPDRWDTAEYVAPERRSAPHQDGKEADA
ncbi:hypothetical protein BGW39_003522, partial [Mortierella sp. 14UC]